MEKKKGPVIIKVISCDCTNGSLRRGFNPPSKESKPVLRIALIEDEDLFYFVAFSDRGYMAIPFKTQLEAVMLFRLVLEEVRNGINTKTKFAGKRINIVREATKEELRMNMDPSWDWIRNQAKNGVPVIQSFMLTKTSSHIFGESVSRKIFDFIR
jgi:hypothetical protein